MLYFDIPIPMFLDNSIISGLLNSHYHLTHFIEYSLFSMYLVPICIYTYILYMYANLKIINVLITKNVAPYIHRIQITTHLNKKCWCLEVHQELTTFICTFSYKLSLQTSIFFNKTAHFGKFIYFLFIRNIIFSWRS